MRIAVIAAALLIAACSKVTQENFSKIQEGLGSPTESNSVNVLGVAGDTVVTVSFVNGKVALKTFDKTKRAP